MFKMGKLTCRPIKFIEPAAKCRNPEIARTIFINRANLVSADTCRIIGIMFIMNKFIVLSIKLI
ncbi:MAG TPA: hypothetical protein VGD14_18865 [bacterium]